MAEKDTRELKGQPWCIHVHVGPSKTPNAKGERGTMSSYVHATSVDAILKIVSVIFARRKDT